jgi:hypothetical protein
LNGCEDGSDVISWAPARRKDVQADAAIVVDVGMEHFAVEFDYWWLVRVVLIKGYGELEDTIFKRRVNRSVNG